MSNINIEDVNLRLTETRNELSEEDSRLWDGLENERLARNAGDDANKSLALQVQDAVSGTERRLSTEVIHREQGDLDKLGVLNQLSQSMSDYRIKTDKEIEAERFARDILGINLDARITTAEASFNHKELKLYQDIQEVFTNLDGKYTSMDARIKKYEDMLQDITMDSINITMDNGEINMGAWTILSQAREWDLEILAKMRGFQDKTTEDVNQALEELQNQLPITENIINEIMENLSESPLIAELRDALNEGIEDTSALAIKLAQEEAARAKAIIDLAYANAQALAAEKAALVESIAAESQARADEVQEEANRRIESIRQIREDIGQEVDLINGQIATDIGLIKTELKNAKDGFNSSIEEVRGETDVVLNELTTYKASNDVAVAGLVSKVNTNVTNTAANASKIEGLTSELATTNTELGKVRNTSATALSKADTAVSANSALANRVDALAAAITDLGEGAETTVDVYAFNALKAEVETNASGVSSLVEQVNALGTNYSNLEDGLTANTEAVSSLVVKQNEMNGDISQLASDVTYLTSELGVLDAAIDANVSAISNTNTELSKVDGKITAANEAATLLSGRVSNVEGEITKKADASALSSLTTRVGTVEGQYTSQASDITQLSNSLDTTNLNVGTAQTAAQNAMTAAGAKGKVIFGNTPPTVADRLVQNLWIDTTGNANTPKRWNGSAWVAVTDKIATDAANAVSALDTVVKTKADVSALNSLTTKVNEEAGKTTANTNSITNLNSEIVVINNNLATKANASALNDIYTKQQTDAKATEIAAGQVSTYDANLVIGGVNLVEKSKLIGGTQNPKDFTLKAFAYPVLNNAAVTSMFTEGETYTVSFEYEIIGKPVPSTANVSQLGFILYSASNAGAHNNPANNYLWWDTGAIGKPIGYKGKITKTFKIATLYDDHVILAYTNRYSTNGVAPFDHDTVRFTNFQIENGSKATAWSPSPEDVQSALDANASAVQNTNTEVSRVDGKTTVNANAITGLNSRMGIVEGQVSTKAEASALQNYYTKTEAAANATTVAAGEVSKYDANLSIGGVNLLSNARGAEWLTQTMSTGWYNVLALNFKIDRTKKYVISFEAEKISGVATRIVVSLAPGVNQDAHMELSGYGVYVDKSARYSIAIDFSKLTLTGTFPEGNDIYLLLRIRNERQAASMRIRYIQIEEGTKATSWSPSPEDVQKALDANATAVTNTNAEVLKVDNRVTTTSNQLTAVAGRVSVVEDGLATKADVSALNNIYTKSEVDAKATSLAAGQIATYDANLVIGGANTYHKDNASIIRLGGTATFVKNHAEAPNGFMLQGDSTGNSAIRIGGVITSNGWWTISFYFRGIQNAAVGFAIDIMDGPYKVVRTTSDNQWTYVEHTQKVVSQNSSNGLHFIDFSSIGYATMYIKDIKVERGSKATAWTPDPRIIDSALEANASALTSTNAEVKRIDDKVISHADQLLSLTSGIAGKADASALNNIYTKAQTDDKIDSVAAGKIEAYKSALVIGGSNQLLNSEAQRVGGNEYLMYESSAHLKQFYDDNLGKDITISFEIMVPVAGAVQAYSSNGSAHVFTLATPWLAANTWTKVAVTGKPQKHPTTPNNSVSTLEFYGTYNTGRKTYVRKVKLEKGNVATDWSPSFRDQPDMSGYATASAVQTLTTEVERVNGVAKSAADSTLDLKSRMGNAENALQVQAKVVDGVKASYMVKMETNGVIGGFGLMQSTGVLGQVVTSFGVNANSFFIGAPASNKQPFIVTTTNQVVNGVTYPAGTYIDVALIANATIGTAKISDLAVTGAKIANATIGNAKISDLDASKITAGFINAARIQAGTLSADKLSSAAIETISLNARNGTFTAADGSKTVINGGLTQVFYPNGKVAVKLGVW